MLGRSEIVSVAGDEPVTLAEAKAQLRVDFDTDDAIIGTYISAARLHCEAYLGYALIDKTVKATFDCFAPYLSLIGPLADAGITSVTYRNSAHVDTTVLATEYTTTSGRTLRLYPATDTGWPNDVATTPGAVVVVYDAKADVTDNVKAAMLLIITSLYQNRDDSVRRYPTASKKFLDLEREPLWT